ncbi:dTMP kinase [Saccharospirillum sp. MSK14-1]|uniref:dTMP kinase n=1 Tax=Saccharospirillum sp. MSK14-1 TaxID=1897632 RepID=UPI000D3CF8E1|nr:dTMP kinase [Saccharospirillum sp. MSK14-1]PTY36628.1 dTMP kinase [Saccharospirillum sp. MSK14-1]
MKAGFITIEGLEGAGKTTQRSVLEGWITQRFGVPLVTREPGGTSIAERIRSLVLSHDDEPLDALSELLLVFAARRQHLTHVIQPALASGQWVISDRFADASFAYQGGGRGLPWSHLQTLEDWVLDGFSPDLTLWLDCPIEVGLARARQRGELDRIEEEDLAFFERARTAYERRYQEHPERIVRLDASVDVDALSRQVVSVLEERFG